jgi:basic amino acid/polyamine antiporter, APA family
LLYRRIRVVGNISVVLAGGVLLGCLWIILAGAPHLTAQRVFNFPAGAFHLSWPFWVGLGHSTLYALYDYFGYYNVCYLAEEIRDPGYVIPRAILLSIAAVGALYLMMTASFLSVIPWQEIVRSRSIASSFVTALHGAAAGKIMTVLILWIAFSSVFSLLLGYSRVPYVAAADGNFFRSFSRLHPKGEFPHVSLVTLGLIAAVFSLGRLSEVIPGLIATRVLIQYLPQTIGFFLLRQRAPDLRRPFRMWLYPVPGIIAICGWIYVLTTAARQSLTFAMAVLIVGTLAYLVRAKLRREWPFLRTTGEYAFNGTDTETTGRFDRE